MNLDNLPLGRSIPERDLQPKPGPCDVLQCHMKLYLLTTFDMLLHIPSSS